MVSIFTSSVSMLVATVIEKNKLLIINYYGGMAAAAKFVITGTGNNGPVVHTGLRANLITYAIEHDVRVFAMNGWVIDVVNVYVEGDDDRSVMAFHNHVSRHDMREMKGLKMYQVEKLDWVQPGNFPWNSYYTMISAEFTIKTMQTLKRMESKTHLSSTDTVV